MISRVVTLFVALLLTGVTAAAAAADTVEFSGPLGVDVNANNIIHVAEISAKRVSKLTADGKFLGEIREIDGYGKLLGPFDVEIGGPAGRIHIVDMRSHRVIVLDANEKLLFVLGDARSAAVGSFAQPHFVAVNDRGEIFVSDMFNARIQKFSPDGQFIKTWGRVGDAPGEFLHNGYLASIDVDNKGFVYVREYDGGRIQKFTEDGQHVATLSQRGTAPGQLDEGYGLAVIDGKLYVPDTYESRIQTFSLDGELLDNWDPGEGNGDNQFNHPVGIAETSAGELIVTDWMNDRVLKLDKGGKFLAIWGRPAEDLLAWQPPAWHDRTGRRPVRFSIYADVGDATIERAQQAGIHVLYPSLSNQYRDWSISDSVANAASRGLEVHPSIACLIFGRGTPNSDVFAEHPDWLIWKKDASDSESTTLSWSHAEARAFRADAIVAQVKASGVQGIMLDYIRYSTADYGYEPAAVEGFAKKFGVDPRTLPTDDQRWMQYRADFVTDFIIEMRRKLATEIPDRHVEVSVYLSHGADTSPGGYLKASLQDWKTWARMGIIDKVNGAWYTRDFDHIYNSVRGLRQAVPDRVKVNAFIASYGGQLNTPELLKKGIDASIAGGADEVTIYRVDAVNELNLWDAIGQAAREAEKR